MPDSRILIHEMNYSKRWKLSELVNLQRISIWMHSENDTVFGICAVKHTVKMHGRRISLFLGKCRLVH